MIALLDNGQDLEECEKEIGCKVGQLLTPLTRYRLRSEIFAIDNGGFNELDIPGLKALLKREHDNRGKCLFVSMPDIVGSAQRTTELFWHFHKDPDFSGWRLAFVCQDGQENLPIPWDFIDAVFIGGSTTWKISMHVVQIIKTAKILGKHVHVGRVNTPERWSWFEKHGADSADGTGLARYTHMRKAIAERGKVKTLFDEVG